MYEWLSCVPLWIYMREVLDFKVNPIFRTSDCSRGDYLFVRFKETLDNVLVDIENKIKIIILSFYNAHFLGIMWYVSIYSFFSTK